MRLAITGGPRTGKTTLASKLTVPRFHTDDYADLGWSEASLEVSKLFDRPGSFVVEGVAVPRSLRKWLKRNEGNTDKPIDEIILLTDPMEDLLPGQASMKKGLETVLTEITPELQRRGVVITTASSKT